MLVKLTLVGLFFGTGTIVALWSTLGWMALVIGPCIASAATMLVAGAHAIISQTKDVGEHPAGLPPQRYRSSF